MKIQIKDCTIKQNPIKGTFDFRAIQEGNHLKGITRIYRTPINTSMPTGTTGQRVDINHATGEVTQTTLQVTWSSKQRKKILISRGSKTTTLSKNEIKKVISNAEEKNYIVEQVGEK